MGLWREQYLVIALIFVSSKITPIKCCNKSVFHFNISFLISTWWITIIKIHRAVTRPYIITIQWLSNRKTICFIRHSNHHCCNTIQTQWRCWEIYLNRSVLVRRTTIRRKIHRIVIRWHIKFSSITCSFNWNWVLLVRYSTSLISL